PTTVSDSDSTTVWINRPGISETISLLNSVPINSDVVFATVGDNVTFGISYDAASGDHVVNAEQNDVEIKDFLPLGTVPLQYFNLHGANPDPLPAPMTLSDYTVTYDTADAVDL